MVVPWFKERQPQFRFFEKLGVGANGELGVIDHQIWNHC
jgi:hypothetical protein